MAWNGDERRSVNWESVVSHMATTNTKLDNMQKSIDGLAAKIETQNGRVTRLERANDTLNGKIAGVGIVGGLVGWLLSFLKN